MKIFGRKSTSAVKRGQSGGLAIAEIVCVQNPYNLAHGGDDALIDAVAEDGIAYLRFFLLGGFSPLQLATLSEVAARLRATPMQVALAWLLQRAPNILLIPGTSSVAHLRRTSPSPRWSCTTTRSPPSTA